MNAITSYSLTALLGVSSMAMGANALEAAVHQYGDSLKVGQKEVCVAKSYQNAAPEQRPEVEASCVLKADAKIDQQLAVVTNLLSSLQGM